MKKNNVVNYLQVPSTGEEDCVRIDVTGLLVKDFTKISNLLFELPLWQFYVERVGNQIFLVGNKFVV